MRRTRFISLMFLMLSLAFFVAPEFRQAMTAPLAGIGDIWGFHTPGRIPLPQLLALAQSAEQRGDMPALAFVALHLPLSEDAEIRRLSDLAVVHDPSLTWIYLHLAYRYSPLWQSSDVGKEMQVWVARLAAWDPENSTPELLRAEIARQGRGASWPSGRSADSTYLDGLAKETDWRSAMEGAFRKSHYDFYSIRRFDLERQVLRQYHWDNPATIILYAQDWPIPDMFNILDYANLLEYKLGTDAESEGHLNDALADYWTVARFGARLRFGGRSYLEGLTGDTLWSGSCGQLVPLLKKQGNNAEAETLAYVVARFRAENDSARDKDLFSRNYNDNWSVLLTSTFAALVAAFLGLTIFCIAYLNVKRYYHPERRGRLWRLLTASENYTPVLLFVSSVALYITYYPFAKNFSYYMTAQGPIENFDGLLYDSTPSYALPSGLGQLRLENPFHGVLLAAAAAILLSILVAKFGQSKRAPVRSQESSTTE